MRTEIVRCGMVLLGIGGAAGALSGAVDPFIGTSGTGHCTPAATCPFGMVQPGPDTGNGSWAYCAGYQHTDTAIDGFSQTHLNGTGQPEMADFLVLPFCGETILRRSSFDHAKESASPGFYSVLLEEAKVKVEITATERVAVYRFTYLGEGAHLLLDLQHALWQERKYERTAVLGGEADFSADGRSVSGWHEEKAYWPQHKVFFHATFDRPFVSWRKIREDADWERAPRFVLDFDVKPGEAVTARIALSYTSGAGARRNLEVEALDADFEEIRDRAACKWNALLSRIEVEGATAEQRTMLDTSLYHLCFQPNVISDVGDTPRYSTFSLWDTFRAAHPLYTLLVPEMVEPFVDSFLDHARKTGFMPIWEIYGQEGFDMLGAHSIPVVLDAYRKGFKVDLAAFYPHVRNTQLKDNRGALGGRDFQKCHWDLYDRLGYFPCDKVTWESLCRLMEVTYDDHCAAEMARTLGETDDAAFFRRRADFWRNAFHPETGYLCPRRTDGTWLEGYDPHFLLRKNERGEVVGDTGEGSGLQWSFHVLHDFDGLVSVMGGRERFVRRLDYLFSHRPFWEGQAEYVNRWPYRDASGRVGEYSHGNEPCHHVSYLYSLSGRRDKTASLVRKIASELYPATPGGMCGNDDCGQLSAWYVFAVLGFYPVDPSSGEYVLGEPIVSSVTVKFPSGRRLRIRRDPGVEGVRFNGCAQGGPTVAHAALVRGGELLFGSPKGAQDVADDTADIQSRIDAAWRAGGGIVSVPSGVHEIRGIRLRSNVTLKLEDNAVLLASRDPDDYRQLLDDRLEPVDPSWADEIESLRWTAMGRDRRAFVRRLMANPCSRWNNGIIRIFCATNVTIVGGRGSAIDGQNCYDPTGEELFRGVHGISCLNSTNVVLKGVELRRTGNWATRYQDCADLLFEDLSIRGGHDGVHVRGCDRVRVRACDIRCGDDCIAGYDNADVTVEDCRFNTACSVFRFGGTHVRVRRCKAWGPGEWPIRNSLPRDKQIAGLDGRDEGRRNMLSFWTYFADATRTIRDQPGDIVIEDCEVANADRFLHYNLSGSERWQCGRPITDITFRRVRAKEIGMSMCAYASGEVPLRLAFDDCEIGFRKPQGEFIRGAYVGWLGLRKVRVHGLDGPCLRVWKGETKIDLEECEGVSPVVERAAIPFSTKSI